MNRTCFLKWLVLVPLILAATAVGPEPIAAQQGPDRASRWTVKDILFEESARSYRISPDGGSVVWVRSVMDEDEGRSVSHLFLTSLADGSELQLTRGKGSQSSPSWSPNGKLIAFMSSRALPEKKEDAASNQLWLIDPRGGEPWPVTKLERGVRGYEWADSATILFIAQEDPTLYEEQEEKREDTSRVVEDEEHEPPVRLFRLSVGDGNVVRLTENDDWMRSISVSPDGRWVVAVHSRSLSYQYDQRVPPVTYLWDLEAGAAEEIFDGSRIIPSDVRWSRDGRGFYFMNDSTSHPRYRNATINVVMYYDLDRGEPQLVDLGWERGAGYDYAVADDGFVVLLADGVHMKPARFTRRGESWRRSWIEGEHAPNMFGLELAEDGRALVYEYSTASMPAQLYRARLQDSRLHDASRLTSLNPSYAKKSKPRSEIVHWRGARDEEVEGILYYPLGYEEERRYPLILMIHGGPAGADRDSWSHSYTRPTVLLNQKGAFVLKANYHGSSSYGLEWVESICCGNYYSLEIPDLENGVDYLIERGLADPEKLATMGWSNGAILSIELTTRNPRYKAASTGAGDVEWISDWANVDFGAAFDDYYFGAHPYEDPQRYVELSPFFRMEDVRTPTIIYFGTEDRNVPTDQGWSHFRALQQIGNVPVKFILFPGEAHGLRKLAHQRRKLEEDLAWFERYLFETYEPENEALKDGSPLAQALKRIAIARVDDRYGRLVRDVLVPEVVEYRGIEIGRFEVTRAQFAEFDDSYAFEPGTEDYPASGIDFERAGAYVAWLSELTGEPYRLGDEDELRPLYEAAGRDGNTLDHWAGYAPNPDDVEQLREEIAELPGAAPLLKRAGSFAGDGEETLVFDLDGNVAEWASAQDGSGILLGASADQPADPKARERVAAEPYRGFRVVVGPRAE